MIYDIRRYLKALWHVRPWKSPYPWKGWTPKGYRFIFSKDYYEFASNPWNRWNRNKLKDM